jgi:UDP-GlcNAc:undecaprenyl-phosphate/decaprenyl-phosphate GlcNAc-1-phosphate transferase
MHALPFVLSLACAGPLAPVLLRSLTQTGHVRANFRGRRLPLPLGLLMPLAALVALIPLTLIARLGRASVFHPELLPIAVYALGVALLGLVDDTIGAGAQAPRGWRGHVAALARGELSTGTLKALGSLGLALLAMLELGLSNGRWLLAAGVLVLATNVFNLLDLRPGRSAKVFPALGAGLTIGAGQLRAPWSLGLFAGPVLVAGYYDLRERAMLGDTGASLLGALAGLWLVLTLGDTGQLIALGLLLAITLYGELRSISALIERTPLLRELDSWGRPS